MTELELYRFVKDNEIEIDWRAEKFLYLWIPFGYLEEFTDLLGYDYLYEGGEEAHLQKDCICIDIVDICEANGIEPTNILPKKNK